MTKKNKKYHIEKNQQQKTNLHPLYVIEANPTIHRTKTNTYILPQATYWLLLSNTS